VVGKNGVKMKEADPNAKDNGTMRIMMDQGKMVMTASGIQMSNFARNLSNSAGRPVFDKTGLTGKYDINMEFAREQNLSASAPNAGPSGAAPTTAPDPIGLSIFDAVQALGLKLVPSRGPMMVIVIEHMDKPDTN
jgi:bla regulator protein BlaR1